MATNKITDAQRNEDFMNATKSQRASIIASDVVLQLQIGRYQPMRGGYLQMSLTSLPKSLSLQEIIRSEDYSCHACALGSAFASCVRFSNQVEIDTTKTMYITLSNCERGYSTMYERLAIAFTKEELDVIEYCFERKNVNSLLSRKTQELVDNSSIGKASVREDDDTERMILIMKHVIKNSGRFSVKGLQLAPNNPNKE